MVSFYAKASAKIIPALGLSLVVAGLVPATPIILALRFNVRGRRDEARRRRWWLLNAIRNLL